MTRTRSDRRSGVWPPALTSIDTFMVARDALVVITALPAIHRAPQAKIEAFRQRIGRPSPGTPPGTATFKHGFGTTPPAPTATAAT